MILRLILLAILILLIVFLLMGRSTLLSFRQGQRLSAGKRAAAKLMRSAQKDPQAFIDSIPEHAQKHVERMKKIFGESLAFRKADLSTIDRVISKAWDNQVPKEMDGLVLTFGAYFGETVRRLEGGRWDYDPERGFCLREVGGVASVYPFDKIRKRFEHGDKESLSVFFTALTRKLDQATNGHS